MIRQIVVFLLFLSDRRCGALQFNAASSTTTQTSRITRKPRIPTWQGTEPQHQHQHDPAFKRRQFLQLVVAAAATTTSTAIIRPVYAAEEPSATTELQQQQSNKPRAPTEALIPATQQRILLQRALEVARAKASSNDEQQQQLLQNDLESILPSPPKGASRNGDRTMPVFLRYKADQRTAQQQAQLSGRAVRASLNIYTANLQFGETYILTASPDQKKNMIRNDQLPNVKAVITADLDLRDLYRNKIQTLVEDAQAELHSSNDAVELEALLREADSAMDKWFSFIALDDVERAREMLAQIESADASSMPIELPKHNFKGWNPWMD